MYPLMTGFNALPKAAFVPILVVWFGIGAGPAILTAFLISFFPIMVNIATGLATLEPELEDVLRVLGARRWDVLIKVGLPRSMPYFYGSAEGGHHAGLRRHHGVGDDGQQRRHRLPADQRRQQRCRWAWPSRPGGGGHHGHGDVRAVLGDREAHHRAGRTAAVRGIEHGRADARADAAPLAPCQRRGAGGDGRRAPPLRCPAGGA